LEFYGQIPKRDIGHSVREGWEEVYGLFQTEDAFKKCLEIMTSIHGSNIDRKGCKLAGEPGLQLDPPLLLESIACGGARFEEYRTSIDVSLRRGVIPRDARDNLLQITQRYIAKARDAAAKVPPSAWILLAKLIYCLITGEIIDP